MAGLAHDATTPSTRPAWASSGWPRRALLVFALGGAGALAVLLDAPLCPSAALLGIPCPGCGLTRATLALLRGDVGGAFHFHPLVFVLSPLFIGLLANALVDYVRGPIQRAPRRRWNTPWLGPALWLLLALMLGVWGARFFGAFGGPAPVRPLAHSHFVGERPAPSMH